MRILRAAILAALMVIVAYAADVSGIWNGRFVFTMPDGQTREDSVHMVLKQEGGKITGTAGPSAGQQVPIAKGMVEGNKVTWELPVPDGVFKFDVAMEGDHLKGEVTRSAGKESMKARMDATRAK